MIAKKGSHFVYFRFVLVGLFVFVFLIAEPISSKANRMDTEVVNSAAFRKTLDAHEYSKALSIGNTLFAQLEQKHKGDASFMAYKSKLKGAEFLAENMQKQLKRATNAQVLSISDELFTKKGSTESASQTLVAPAKSFYETSIGLFSQPVKIDNFTEEEKSFLAQYYDLKLKVLTSQIAKTGQALAIAEPSFKGTYDYVLVLPLLHVSDETSINVGVLPQWMQRPDQLDTFADSCLLHFGMPFQAMSLAKKSAQFRNALFTERDFYKSAAKKCGTSRAHIAADCLQRAIDHARDEGSGETIALEFETVQLWLDSGNYPLAASQAHRISQTYPDHKESGKAIWLYYYALSRSGNINGILADIDTTLDDKRCAPYKPKLMYIKWWALRRKRDQDAKVAVLEYELLKNYGDDPMIAPIMLSRVTDLLASQDYTSAYELSTQLVEKFPTTKAAIQANKMLAKLKAMREAK
jgi:hypothetical protein